VWWANTVAIGSGMGEAFGRGLLRAAGVEGDSLDLSRKLGGDRPTVVRVLVELSAVLTSIDVGFNDLDEETALSIVRAVRPRDKLTFLGLRSCGIGASGAKEIAEFIQFSAVPTDCNLLHNNLDVESATMLAKIGTEKGIMLSGIKRHQTEADFSYHGLQSADGILIASDLRVSAVLKTIVLSGNSIRDEGAIALGESLKTNKSLEGLELRSCDIGPEGAKGLADALASGSAVLTDCSLIKNTFDVESAKTLAKIAAEKRIMLSGMKRDQKEASFFNQGLEPADAILITSDMQFMAVLTRLDVRGNFRMGDDEKQALRTATNGRQDFVLQM